MKVEPKLVSILMVDDDSLDVELFHRTLRKRKFINPFVVAQDGVEALEILRGRHPTKSVERPLLVMMDLNMPRMDGIECINEIRNDSELKDHIVFMMTTSAADQDRCHAYRLNVAGKMKKKDLGTSFTKALEMLDNYWNAIVFPGTY